jgi:hypothetical protein
MLAFVDACLSQRQRSFGFFHTVRSNAYVALLDQHELAGGPKTLGNDRVAVGLPVVGGPVQGRPVNAFVPVDKFRAGSDGETGVSRGWVTVFPLITGLTVFPLSSGLLVFCASDTVAVKVRTRALRPTIMRFAVMVDLPFDRPKSFNAELLSGLLPGTTPHDSPSLPCSLEHERGQNVAEHGHSSSVRRTF